MEPSACHEAGHAIADTHQRMRVKYCTIIPGDDYAGASVSCAPVREESSRARKEAAIISLLAGELVELPTNRLAKWILICVNCRSEFQHSQISDVPMSLSVYLPAKPEFPPTGNQCVCPNCGFSGTYRRTDLLYRP